MNRSESINELIAALAAAQKEFDPIYKDTDNPFYKSKYADLSSIVKATQPALNKHGLTIIQGVGCQVDTATVAIETMLAHTSGQWMSETLHLPGTQKDRFDAQSVGSSITYGRRYGWQSITGVCADVDDDGNAAAGIGSKEAAKNVAASKLRKAANGQEGVTLVPWKDNLLAIQGNGLTILKASISDVDRAKINPKFDKVSNVWTLPILEGHTFASLCEHYNVECKWDE